MKKFDYSKNGLILLLMGTIALNDTSWYFIAGLVAAAIGVGIEYYLYVSEKNSSEIKVDFEDDVLKIHHKDGSTRVLDYSGDTPQDYIIPSSGN